MIPFKLWNHNERNIFKAKYGCHPSTTNYTVPDPGWHIVYFLLRLRSDLGKLVFRLVFIRAENLLIFEQIFKKYNIPMEAFFALGVAGKSSSWDHTHNFSQGKIPRAIAEAPLYLQPKLRGLEESKWVKVFLKVS